MVDLEDGSTINRIDCFINWPKRCYDNKSGASLEAVVRNMCACDSLSRNHYSGYMCFLCVSVV